MAVKKDCCKKNVKTSICAKLATDEQRSATTRARKTIITELLRYINHNSHTNFKQILLNYLQR